MERRTLRTKYQRQLLIGTTGRLCFVVHYLTLSILMHFEAGPVWLCNAAAFLMSTQLNCLMSQNLTWKPIVQMMRAKFWQRFMKYNSTDLVLLTLTRRALVSFTS